MGYTICDLHCNSSVKRTFVHLTFNQVVAGSIPARPTNKINELSLVRWIFNFAWVTSGLQATTLGGHL